MRVRKPVLLVAMTVLALSVPAAANAAPSSAPSVAAAAAAPQKVVSAYFADWDVYGAGYFVKDIPADSLNVIQYAFGVPTWDDASQTAGCSVLDPWADYQQPYTAGTAVNGVADDPADPNQHLYGSFNQLAELKASHPGLKVEISLGGWTKSTWFSTVAATAQRRQAFVAACLSTFIEGNLPGDSWPPSAGGAGAAAGLFDGIDVDWEYPTQVAGGNVGVSAADRHNATLLLAEFRHQLDALGVQNGKHYLLTAALPAAKSSTKYYELSKAVTYLDWANVMAYDYNTVSGTSAAPNSPMGIDRRDAQHKDPTWNTTGTIAWYLLHGVPASKLVVGVPFYANQYLGTDQLYGAFDNTGLDPNSLAWDETPNPSYGAISAANLTANGWVRHWNAATGTPWLSNPAATRTLSTGPVTGPSVITYDDPASLHERTLLIKALHLRGAMAWEISQDSSDHALIDELATIMG